MRNIQLSTVTALLLLGAIVWALQTRAIHSRLAALERANGSPALPGEKVTVTKSPPRTNLSERELQQRVTLLEQSVAELTRVAQRLAEGGRVAVSTNHMEDLHRRLLDASLSDSERLHALRVLRKNRGLDEETLRGALDWLAGSGEKSTRREILKLLEGSTNGLMRQPLLSLAANDADPKLREQAVESLRAFVSDPTVEKQLWAMLQSEQNPDIRKQAEEALRKGPMTPERQARLLQQAIDSQAGVRERLTAWHALEGAGSDIASATAALAQLAQSSQDPAVRADIYKAFDKSKDPSVVLPLVNGLQDSDPRVRKQAADAIGSFAKDPRIQEWLNFLASSDPDQKVRKEAAQALKQLQKR